MGLLGSPQVLLIFAITFSVIDTITANEGRSKSSVTLEPALKCI